MADPTPENQVPSEPISPPQGRKLLSVVLFCAGIALLGAALWVVLRQGDTFSHAMEAAREAPAWLIVLCLTLPLLNWLATSGVLWVLTGRYGRVHPAEMAALIGAAWLLNLLPMRPGMVGRVAYHKECNGIRVRDSIRVLFAALLCTGCALVLLIAMVSFGGRLPRTVGMVLVGGAPILILAAVTVALRRTGHAWRWPAAIGCRYLDMVTWAARYMIVFAIIGQPIGLVGGGGVTAVSQVAMLVPVQLGLREWAVGIASTVLPGMNLPASATAGGVVDAAAPALIADGMMRAAELAVVAPLGTVASIWLLRRLRAARAKREGVEAKVGAGNA